MDFSIGAISGAVVGAVISILIAARINGEDASLIGAVVFVGLTVFCGSAGHGLGRLVTKLFARRSGSLRHHQGMN